VSSWLGPLIAFAVSGIAAGSSQLYDDRAEAYLRKYERCLEEENEKEFQLQREKEKLKAEVDRKKDKKAFKDN
jgi:hypothetical protein